MIFNQTLPAQGGGGTQTYRAFLTDYAISAGLTLSSDMPTAISPGSTQLDVAPGSSFYVRCSRVDGNLSRALGCKTKQVPLLKSSGNLDTLYIYREYTMPEEWVEVSSTNEPSLMRVRVADEANGYVGVLNARPNADGSEFVLVDPATQEIIVTSTAGADGLTLVVSADEGETFEPALLILESEEFGEFYSIGYSVGDGVPLVVSVE